MTEDVTEIFGVVVEGPSQGPILMEVEADGTSRQAACDHLRQLLSSGGYWFRGCVVRIEYESGNAAVLHTMKGMQK